MAASSILVLCTTINSTVAGNQSLDGGALGLGGGIFNASANGFGYGMNLHLANSTLYGNSAASGGGLYNEHANTAEVILRQHRVRLSRARAKAAATSSIPAPVPPMRPRPSSRAAAPAVWSMAVAATSSGTMPGSMAWATGAGSLARCGCCPPAHCATAVRTRWRWMTGAQPLTHDQRNVSSIPRSEGGVVDIGAFEFAGDLLFRDGFDAAP